MREFPIYTYTTDSGVRDFLVQLTYEYFREDSEWVGVCLELETSAYSDDLDSAREELQDAVALQLSEVERLGYLHEYLADNRVMAHKTTVPTAPRIQSGRLSRTCLSQAAG